MSTLNSFVVLNKTNTLIGNKSTTQITNPFALHDLMTSTGRCPSNTAMLITFMFCFLFFFFISLFAYGYGSSGFSADMLLILARSTTSVTLTVIRESIFFCRVDIVR